MAKMRWIALAWFLALGTFGVEGSDARAGSPPCKLATKGDSPVAKACQDGGVEAATKVMRTMRKIVNEAGGAKITCKECHDGDGDSRYDTLTKDGRDRFKSFLADYEKRK